MAWRGPKNGVVNWQTTLQRAGHALTQNIEVRGSHCGMTFNPAIWYLVADRLSQPVDGWKPFERRSWTSLLYPAAAH